jgi:hypothetical protein
MILSVLIMVVALLAALYFGIWWAFIGGIVQVIDQLRAPQMNSLLIAIGIAKVMFAGLIGWITFVIGIVAAKIVNG